MPWVKLPSSSKTLTQKVLKQSLLLENSPAPKLRLYGTFKPVIPGYGDKESDVDLVTFDVYAAPVVKATTITCVKGKTTKKVTAVNPKCPTGYKKK